MTSHHQELILEKIVPFLENDKKIRLLVVDSIIKNYRAEFSDVHMLSERQQRLYQFMCKLSSMHKRTELRLLWQTRSTTRLIQIQQSQLEEILWLIAVLIEFLRRLHPDHNDNSRVRIVAKIAASLYHPENQARFMLSEKGIEDIQKS